jgi:hypothetical protein
MSDGSSSALKFEIGHVLFIDIVGYSKLLINEQSEQLQKLKEIVRGTEQFRIAEAEGKLLRLPTGDGGALVFRTTPEAPVSCGLEIARELKNHPELPVRMGIHSGPVNEVTDLNEQANIAGAGINIAQRVMDCGDAGHILLSKHVADDLEHYAHWRSLLYDLGECEVKHGVRIGIVNLHRDGIGNPQIPKKFRQAKAARVAKLWKIGAAVLVFGLLLAGPFVSAVSNVCFDGGGCDINHPTYVNVFWDSSESQWNQDVQATDPSATVDRLDALLRALVHSRYFASLAQYHVTSVKMRAGVVVRERKAERVIANGDGRAAAWRAPKLKAGQEAD